MSDSDIDRLLTLPAHVSGLVVISSLSDVAFRTRVRVRFAPRSGEVRDLLDWGGAFLSISLFPSAPSSVRLGYETLRFCLSQTFFPSLKPTDQVDGIWAQTWCVLLTDGPSGLAVK